MNNQRVTDIWGARTPYSFGTPWPDRVDSFLVDGVSEADVDRWVRSACLLCSNDCGLEDAVSSDILTEIAHGNDKWLWFVAEHLQQGEPAGATTMIVSLGIISSFAGLIAIMVGVILLVAQAMIINRLADIPYPWWAPHGAKRVSRA